MIVHDLKTWPAYFRPLWDGEKTFEIRFDDRGYQRGDLVNLREWDRGRTCECGSSNHVTECARYTGRRIVAEIGYVTASTAPRGAQRGFEGHGYVVFSLINADRVDAGEDDAAAEVLPGAMWDAARLPSPLDVAARRPADRFSVDVPQQRRPDSP